MSSCRMRQNYLWNWWNGLTQRAIGLQRVRQFSNWGDQPLPRCCNATLSRQLTCLTASAVCKLVIISRVYTSVLRRLSPSMFYATDRQSSYRIEFLQGICNSLRGSPNHLVLFVPSSLAFQVGWIMEGSIRSELSAAYGWRAIDQIVWTFSHSAFS